MTTLYLVRHGETTDNVAQIMQGQLHGELTPNGVSQMEELAKSLSDVHFDAVVSSDLKRAFDSAMILTRHFDLPVQETQLLRERDWGDFTGRYVPDLKGLPMPENVEDMETLLQRATDFLDWIYFNMYNKTILAVGHGIINKAIQTVFYNKQTREISKMQNAECRVLKFESRLVIQGWGTAKRTFTHIYK